jgi:ribokinase
LSGIDERSSNRARKCSSLPEILFPGGFFLVTITVVGSINLDLIATVERLPAPGETVTGGDFSTAPGGKGANQALAARRAGAQVRMIGAVGKDAFAGEALSLLEGGGVDLSHVGRMHAPTGTALILVDAKGENVIAVVPGANKSVLPGDLAAAGLKKGEYLLLQQEIPLETVEGALKAAQKAGAVSVLNTAPFRAQAAAFIGEADYIVANETEFDLYADALSLPGGDRTRRMAAFAERTGRTLIVTLGAEGVLAAAPGEALAVPALKVTPVDTVGAGDTFCGYLASSLASGLPLEQALRRATAAASLACLKEGAQPSIPLAAEVDRAMKR